MTTGYQNFFITFPDSNSTVQVYPAGEFIESIDVLKSFDRTEGGKLYSYKIANSEQYRYTFPLTFINSSDKHVIDTLWRNQTEFNFTLQNDALNYVVPVRISNQTAPLPSKVDQNFDKWEGILNLISNGTPQTESTSISAWIWDDPVFGVWDGQGVFS